MIRRIAERVVAVDVAVAALLALAVVVEVGAGADESAAFPREPDSLGTALAIAATLPIAWRRSRPVAVLGVCVGLYLVRLALGYPTVGGSDVAAVLSAYSVGVHAARPLSNVVRGVASAATATGIGAAAVADWIAPGTAVLMLGTWFAFVWAGEGGYHRRLHREALEERAARLEAEHEEQARIAVQEERARISREFHDVWAHTLSLVVVQAGAALEVLDDAPDQARRSLSVIQQAGRRALGEIRRLIATEPGLPGVSGGPAPGLHDLPRLIEEMRGVGLRLDLSTSGLDRELPGDLSMNAFRIVQQALTNVLSHAGVGAAAHVEVAASDGALAVSVVDDGGGTPLGAGPGRVGRGLVGMRQRVALYGGSLVAEPRPEGGFAVRARLPIEVGP